MLQAFSQRGPDLLGALPGSEALADVGFRPKDFINPIGCDFPAPDLVGEAVELFDLLGFGGDALPHQLGDGLRLVSGLIEDDFKLPDLQRDQLLALGQQAPAGFNVLDAAGKGGQRLVGGAGSLGVGVVALDDARVGLPLGLRRRVAQISIGGGVVVEKTLRLHLDLRCSPARSAAQQNQASQYNQETGGSVHCASPPAPAKPG